MQKRSSFFPTFLIFLFLIGLVFLFSQTKIFKGIGGFFGTATLPLQKYTFGIFNSSNKSAEDKLREENFKLSTEIVKLREIEKENKALHDQFAVSNPSSRKLMPAQIIGKHDDEMIIDKGSQDGIKKGQVVVLKDNIVGLISDVSLHRGVVRLLTNDKTSFTAKTVKTNASGVISGKGGEQILLDKVLLSESLEKGDFVVTKGDIDASGRGYPPDLIVGKIVSINKKASNLFQSAEVVSLVDVSKLELVFVLLQQ